VDLVARQTIAEYNLPSGAGHLFQRVSLTPGPGRFALPLQTNAVAVFDAETGAPLGPPVQMSAAVEWFTLSADGKRLATAIHAEAQVWNVRTGQALFSPARLPGPPACLEFSDDGRWLWCVAGSSVWVLRSDTGSKERELPIGVCAAMFLGQMESLITFSHDTTSSPRVFDFRGRENRYSASDPLSIDAQRHRVLALTVLSLAGVKSQGPAQVRINDPASGRPQAEPFIHESPILLAKFSPDGRVVATASQDRTVRIWSMAMSQPEGLPLSVDSSVSGANVWEAQWSPDGNQVLSAAARGEKGELLLWDAHSGALLKPPRNLDALVFFAHWAPDGTRFATGDGDRNAIIWNSQTLEPVSPPLPHENGVAHCLFSPGGDVLATAANVPWVRLWDGRNGEAIGAPMRLSDIPVKLCFSSDGRRLATASTDGTIHVWSVPEGELILGPLRHAGLCWIAAFSPDDRTLVSASSDKTAQLWNAVTGERLHPPLRHESPVLWASFSPDGRAIATSTEAGIVRVWNAASGQLISEVMRHPGKVWLVKWSPDGRFLATTCTDGSARVWDARRGRLVAEPFSHPAEVRRAEFSPDGRRLLTASFDRTVKIWELGFLRPPSPAPDWLPELAEALVSKRIDANGAPVSVSGDTFQRVKERIAQAGSNDDYYTRWAKWMLEERLERPVKPFRP